MLDSLAQYLYSKRGGKKTLTPILLLGAGCSVSSGCPTTKCIIEGIIKEHKLEDITPKESPLKDIESKLGKETFNESLKEFFSNSAPSEGYWFLASLIKRGYFDLILTTNYDTCLEKSLAMTMNYDDFKVFIRGDIEDDRIDCLIRETLTTVKIIKVHGDYQSKNMIAEPTEIWDIKSPLKETLERFIEDRGILIVGCSVSDSPLLRLLPKDKKQKYWYVDLKKPKKNSDTRKNLDFIGIKENHIISGKKGEFDNFFRTLPLMLGEEEQQSSEILAELKNELSDEKNLEKLLSSSKIEVDRRTLDDLISTLKIKVQRKCPTINNLVFIHDTDAPGGAEIFKILRSSFPKWIQHKKCFILDIAGREAEIYKRKATGLFDVNQNEVSQSAIEEDDRKFLLIDSVSFTGGTIKKSKDKLIEIFGSDIKVRAAVIYTGQELEKRLKEDKFCIKNRYFYKVEEINSHQILFPWGWTSSTVSIFPNEKKLSHLKIINEFLPNKYFSFLPRPWGNIFSLVENQNVTVKILYINPREKTSQHKHYVRDEIFLALDDYIVFQIWDKDILLKRGSSIRVPAGTIHRLIGLDIPCRVLEISKNYNNQVEDIKRYKDKYGRESKKGDV